MIKSTKKYVALAAVVTLCQFAGGQSAYAKKPLDVDCDVLDATNTAVNDFLDAGSGLDYTNLGSLLVAAMDDPALFGNLSGLIWAFSGGQIQFTSASQLLTTNAKCGLVPSLLDDIRD